mmetsp:Transcript_58029/g.186425  ORF Transcript_58029/g.186425 Transcript_58029/m.186425 type:complete len:336 (+) Transcript_58029:1153-2160(+)
MAGPRQAHPCMGAWQAINLAQARLHSSQCLGTPAPGCHPQTRPWERCHRMLQAFPALHRQCSASTSVAPQATPQRRRAMQQASPAICKASRGTRRPRKGTPSSHTATLLPAMQRPSHPTYRLAIKPMRLPVSRPTQATSRHMLQGSRPSRSSIRAMQRSLMPMHRSSRARATGHHRATHRRPMLVTVSGNRASRSRALCSTRWAHSRACRSRARCNKAPMAMCSSRALARSLQEEPWPTAAILVVQAKRSPCSPNFSCSRLTTAARTRLVLPLRACPTSLSTMLGSSTTCTALTPRPCLPAALVGSLRRHNWQWVTWQPHHLTVPQQPVHRCHSR